ncbi:gamma carbonic anhydrase family protein [Candidatus Sumerlaeota bacterium]|nr:gamma carbonic anhydrase family protein [Candidatus Sumerlaeota bacterium]HNM46761.1 gamma carbonic anhydrase family protein [Candidatus Sumerlaeota bacterium]
MPIIPFENFTPRIHPSAFIAPNAIILGDVEIGEESTVWYGCVLRGDLDPIRIGRRSNIQDNTVIHTGKGEPCIIHDEVTVGHAAIVHGCEVKSRALIGMGACVLNRAVIGEDCIVGAKALVTEDKKFEARCLIAGIPAKFVRRVTDADLAQIRTFMLRYVENGKRHRAAVELWAANPR